MEWDRAEGHQVLNAAQRKEVRERKKEDRGARELERRDRNDRDRERNSKPRRRTEDRDESRGGTPPRRKKNRTSESDSEENSPKDPRKFDKESLRLVRKYASARGNKSK